MLRGVLGLAAAAALAGVAAPRHDASPLVAPVSLTPGVEGYWFMGDGEPPKRRVAIRMFYYRTHADLIRAFAERSGRKVEDLQLVRGFAYHGLDPCEIHIMDPMIEYTPERAGHELLHCTHGRWHPYK